MSQTQNDEGVLLLEKRGLSPPGTQEPSLRQTQLSVVAIQPQDHLSRCPHRVFRLHVHNTDAAMWCSAISASVLSHARCGLGPSANVPTNVRQASTRASYVDGG